MIIPYNYIKNLYARFKYPFFTKPFDLNVMAFRNPEKSNNNVYNDFEVIAYKDTFGKDHVDIFPCTTEPGLTSLLKPINPKGTAIIKAGYYHSLWRPGLHKGEPALVQINPVTLYRDNDKDSIAEATPIVETVMAGIDNHGARKDRVVKYVNDFSAGCVVVPDILHMKSILLLVDRQKFQGLGDKVSFALFEDPVVFDPDVVFK